ncbi:MAG: biotin--[acetyl-CoA-carboxylase] ligase [Clostridiales bacterium]|nr:biotin--[acetyl-CoA-carboxylase] ligase [Clostridiales bacterium]
MSKLDPNDIKKYLKTKDIGSEIVYFETLDSTNNYAKEIAKKSPHGLVIIANEQTGGRGRLGRSWFTSKGKNISMTIILKPDIHPTEAMKMTQIAIAAMVVAVRELTGLHTLVKWPNDLLIENKKIAGILTEMVANANKIDYLIIGMGINVNTKIFPKEIEDMASSLALFKGADIDRQKLIIKILEEFEKLYLDYIKKGDLDKSLDIVRKYSAILDKDIYIIKGQDRYKARAVDIDHSGVLKVKHIDGREELLHSGEVSIRGKATYI